MVVSQGGIMARAGKCRTERLEALCRRVEAWRKRRPGGRSPVPEGLWNEAVEVAGVDGIYATAKATRFNYYSLKDRMLVAGSAGALTRASGADGAGFVEVEMPSAAPAGGGREAATADGKAVVELVGPSGARMRIDITGTSGVDVVGLAQAFWSREP
jgi:hypothetical protein